jgi:glycosyltransferase involved in cell wall biosynthesis
VRFRVAFIDYFPTHYRRGLYEELARRMDVDFYFFADERERYWNRKLPLARGGDFREVNLRRWRIAGQAVMPGVVFTLSRNRYDAVIKSLNGKLMLPLTIGAARARGVRFVLWTGMWTHPTTPIHRVSHPVTEAVYRRSDAIVAYGEHVRRFLLQVEGVTADKVFVAGQAVDHSRFATVRPSHDGDFPQILYIGQFEERKGLHYLLDAAASLSDVPLRVRLVGNGSQEPQVRARAAALGNVEVVGYVPQDDLPAQLARSRCVVLPSITTALDKEPWGLVLNEAMHAGLPVVATDAVGAAAGGLVRDGRNGYVVPERDARALAAALSRLATDADLAARLGEQARIDASAFTHARMADAFEAAVEYAVARPVS